jgi:hypothetical protein
VTPAATPAHCYAHHTGSLGQSGDGDVRRNHAAPSERQGDERSSADLDPTGEVDDAPELRARRLRWAQL